VKTKAIVAICVLMALSAVPAVAGQGDARIVSYEYSGPNSVELGENGSGSFGIYTVAKPRAGESSVSVEIVDESGRPVFAGLHQANRELGDFCGQSDDLLLETKKALHVHLYMGEGCDDISTPTEGTITLTFQK
jgi:hypothetical protein